MENKLENLTVGIFAKAAGFTQGREKQAGLARMEAALSDMVHAYHETKGNVSCSIIALLKGEKSLHSAGSGLSTGA